MKINEFNTCTYFEEYRMPGGYLCLDLSFNFTNTNYLGWQGNFCCNVGWF